MVELYGIRLRQMRKERSISQLELELASGLTHGTISRIETGKINPTKETLYKISYTLDLCTEEVIKLFCIDVLVIEEITELDKLSKIISTSLQKNL